jgi:GPH family glycoside/pentoside/hexuronide:cation symporter
MEKKISGKVSIKEKIAYALGDASANIAWRGVSTFLFIFYTDVFGLTPATVGLLLLIARFGDGVSDIFMGVIGDRTKSKYGNFRPWILWTAVPLGIILSLLFTSPDWSVEWKIVYAYTTYILFTLIYTANNIPYGALMAVMTDDDKERTSIGSYRMAGAFAGGMVVQGALLYLVLFFGNINPTVAVVPVEEAKYEVTVSSPKDVKNVNIRTKEGIALFEWDDSSVKDTATVGKSFSMEANKSYSFIVTGESDLDASKISVIDQKQGYGKAIYSLSVVMVVCLLITFYFTRERVAPPKEQKNNLKKDFIDLIHNKPWLVLLLIGLLFNVYNAIKQGITVIYFTHYIHDQLLAASYMVGLMLVSIAGAMAATPLSRRFGKKNLFIGALIFSGLVNALLYFCGPRDIVAIFTIGLISEFAAAIFPTLFFVMLGDAADYSECVNGRRATGLVYSAGSFATKFGGGIAGAIIGWILAWFGYNGQDAVAIQGATEGIIILMSWVPGVIAVITAFFMALYPLNQTKMDEITSELISRRVKNQ